MSPTFVHTAHPSLLAVDAVYKPAFEFILIVTGFLLGFFFFFLLLVSNVIGVSIGIGLSST